jgi:hypothetical protein
MVVRMNPIPSSNPSRPSSRLDTVAGTAEAAGGARRQNLLGQAMQLMTQQAQLKNLGKSLSQFQQNVRQTLGVPLPRSNEPVNGLQLTRAAIPAATSPPVAVASPMEVRLAAGSEVDAPLTARAGALEVATQRAAADEEIRARIRDFAQRSGRENWSAEFPDLARQFTAINAALNAA